MLMLMQRSKSCFMLYFSYHANVCQKIRWPQLHSISKCGLVYVFLLAGKAKIVLFLNLQFMGTVNESAFEVITSMWSINFNCFVKSTSRSFYYESPSSFFLYFLRFGFHLRILFFPLHWTLHIHFSSPQYFIPSFFSFCP